MLYFKTFQIILNPQHHKMLFIFGVTAFKSLTASRINANNVMPKNQSENTVIPDMNCNALNSTNLIHQH